MSNHAKYLYTVSYRMDRGDFVALTKVVTRQKPWRVVLELVLYFGALLAIAALTGGPQNLLDTLGRFVTGPLFFVYLPLILVGPVLLLLTPQITGLIASLVYNRNAMADREVTLHLTAESIEGGATDLYSRVGWGAVLKLVETPAHLFLQISRREALFIPRRAVPNEDQYNNLRGFIRARTGLSTFPR
jgi:hypothetical protein